MTFLDHKKLALIHIVKRDLNLSDQEYRDMLEQVAGVRSARNLDEEGFRRLMRSFARSSHYQVNPHGPPSARSCSSTILLLTWRGTKAICAIFSTSIIKRTELKN